MSSLFSGPLPITPWIEDSVLQAIRGEPITSKRVKLVQILEVGRPTKLQPPTYYSVSDGKSRIVVVLTNQEAQNKLIPTLHSSDVPEQGCIARLTDWDVTSVELLCKDHGFTRDQLGGAGVPGFDSISVCLKTSCPVEAKGGRGLGVVGNPIDVNVAVNVRQVFESFAFRLDVLHARLYQHSLFTANEEMRSQNINATGNLTATATDKDASAGLPLGSVADLHNFDKFALFCATHCGKTLQGDSADQTRRSTIGRDCNDLKHTQAKHVDLLSRDKMTVTESTPQIALLGAEHERSAKKSCRSHDVFKSMDDSGDGRDHDGMGIDDVLVLDKDDDDDDVEDSGNLETQQPNVASIGSIHHTMLHTMISGPSQPGRKIDIAETYKETASSIVYDECDGLLGESRELVTANALQCGQIMTAVEERGDDQSERIGADKAICANSVPEQPAGGMTEADPIDLAYLQDEHAAQLANIKRRRRKKVRLGGDSLRAMILK